MKRKFVLVLMLFSLLALGQQNEKEIISEATDAQETQETPQYVRTAENLMKRNGGINNRNSVTNRKVDAYIKGVFASKDKIYFLVDFNNRSNIPYEFESVIFNSPIPDMKAKNVRGMTDVEEIIYTPIWDNRPEIVDRKSKVRMVFVFDRFTVSSSRDLKLMFTEVDGERTLDLTIRNKFLTQANYVK